MLRRIFFKIQGVIKERGIARAIILLASTTVLAHAITALGMPVLARLYSPEEFGTLAAYTSTILMVSTALALRYEMAIPLPKSDDEAWQLVGVSSVSVLVSVLIASLVAVIFVNENALTREYGFNFEHPFLIVIALGVIGFVNIAVAWVIRKKDFLILSRSRILQSVATVASQILFFYLPIKVGGLVIGYLIGLLAMLLMLLMQVRADWIYRGNKLKRRRMLVTARKFKDFPKYSVIETLLSQAAIHLPILMIASLVGKGEAGYLGMAVYIMQIPMALLGNSVAQVYVSRAPEEHRSGNIDKFTNKVVVNLFKIGFFPFLLGGVFSPYLFEIAFGPQWEKSGDLVLWMVPWFFVQFVTSPVSVVLHVLNRQNVAMWMQLVLFLLRVGGVMIAVWYLKEYVLEIYAVMGFVAYSVYYAVVRGVIRKVRR